MGWVSVGLAMGISGCGSGCGQWWLVVMGVVGLGFAVGFSLFHNGFRLILVCFAMGFDGQWSGLGF